MEVGFTNILLQIGDLLTSSQLKSIKRNLNGHIGKDILSLVTNGRDLMMTLLRLKLISATKKSFLCHLLSSCDGGEEHVKTIDKFFKEMNDEKKEEDQVRLIARLKMIGQRQRVAMEEYKTKVDSIDIKYQGLRSQKKQLLSLLTETEYQIQKLQKEEDQQRKNMEALAEVRNEKDNVRRIEAYQLKKLTTEKENLEVQMKKLNEDLVSTGKNRVNTFDRAHVKSELKKSELRVDSLVVKIGKQEQKLNAAEKDVKLFSLEKSECKEKLRVNELALHITAKKLDELKDELEEVNENILEVMEDLHVWQSKFVEMENTSIVSKMKIQELQQQQPNVQGTGTNCEVVNIACSTEHYSSLRELAESMDTKSIDYNLFGWKSLIMNLPQLKNPVAMDVDQNGDVVVVGKKDKKLMLLTKGGAVGCVIDLDILCPVDVAVFNDKYVVIGHREIRIYESSNTMLMKKLVPFYVSDEMELPHLVSVTVNTEDERIMMVDQSNCAIQVYTYDGVFQRLMCLSEHMELPHRVNMLSDGKFSVTDAERHRITIFSTQGVHEFTTIGQPGYGYGEFMHPCAVNEDPSGNLVVADRDNHRIHVLTKQGDHVALHGMLGSGAKELDCPRDVKFYGKGLVLVLDANNKRIVVYC